MNDLDEDPVLSMADLCLSPKERIACYLRMKALSHSEIAAELGVSSSTVGNKLRLATKKIRGLADAIEAMKVGPLV